MSSSDFAALGITVDATKAVKGLDDLDKATESVVGGSKKLDATLQAQNRQMSQSNAIAGSFAAAQRKLTDAEIETAIAGDKFVISLQRQADAIGKTKYELLAMQAAELGVAKDAQPLIEQMKKTDAAMRGAGNSASMLALKSADAREDLRIFATALSNGDIGMAAAQMGQFSQRTGGASLLLSAITNPAVIAAAAIAGFSMAAYMGSQESQKLADSLKLTGGYAGITEGQFNSLARSMAAAESQGIGAAREALQGIVSTGRFTSESLQAVGQAAMSYAKITGQSSEDVIKQFSGMADGVTRWAIKHNEQHHFVTLAQLEHIDMLEKQGEKQKAMAATARYIDEALKTQTENLGIAQRAWRSIRDTAGEAWDAMLGIGRKSTPDEKIAAITSGITSRHKAAKTGLIRVTPEQVAAQDAADVKALTALYAEKFKLEKDARDKEEKGIRDEKAITAKGYLDKLGEHQKGQSRITTELKKYDQELANFIAGGGKRSAEQIAADKKQIAEQYKEAAAPKGRTARLRDPEQSQVALQDEVGKSQLDAIKRATDQQQKAVDFAHKNGLIADDVYYKAKTDLAEGAARQELAVMDEQMQALLGRAKFRDDTERNQNAQLIVALNAKIAAKQADFQWSQLQNQADAMQSVEAKKFNDLLFEQKRIQADLKAGREAIADGKRAGWTDTEVLQATDALYLSIGQRLTPIRDAMIAIAAARPFDEKLQAAIVTVDDQLRSASAAAGQYKATLDRMGSDALTTFFNDTLSRTKSVGEAFKDMAKNFALQLIKMESAAMASKLMQSFGGLSGIGSAIAGAFTASANGNAFSGGRLTPFANGGAFTNSVTTGPTVAPMALFGEAGPEAIMPLSRDGSGKLGVKASGTGGAPSFVFQNTYNVSADADKAYVQRMVEASQRNTQAQIADQMKRNKYAYGR